jgi:hypothetical protein
MRDYNVVSGGTVLEGRTETLLFEVWQGHYCRGGLGMPVLV